MGVGSKIIPYGPAEMIARGISRGELMVGDTGFEPTGAPTRTDTPAGTGRGQVGESQEASPSQGELSKEDLGHPEDASERSACCAYVARPETPPDLARLAEIWSEIPEATRAAILTLAEGARRAE